MRVRYALIAAVAALGAAACTQNTAGGALGGAALGAGAGAIIGNNTGSGDAQQGALVGAAVGAAAGAYAGCVRDGNCGGSVNRREHYDQRSGRYYFSDPKSGRLYYENGDPYP
ncbi:MAG: YMGG-like glycine zipper-containing protein [Terricaulis sp.]